MVYKGVFEKDGDLLIMMLESGINEAEIKQWSKPLLQCAMEFFDLSIVENFFYMVLKLNIWGKYRE